MVVDPSFGTFAAANLQRTGGFELILQPIGCIVCSDQLDEAKGRRPGIEENSYDKEVHVAITTAQSLFCHVSIGYVYI